MPTWKEKKDQGIQNPFEREIITKFFRSKDNKWILSLKKRDLVWSTMYGILKWGGEGPHEGIISGRDVPEIAERLGDSVPSD